MSDRDISSPNRASVGGQQAPFDAFIREVERTFGEPEAAEVERILDRMRLTITRVCRDCFVHYRHGNPSPWRCPQCGTRWQVRHRAWERVSMAAARTTEGDR